MIKKFTVCAERNCGTNYIERLIPKVFDLKYTFDFGPKHFMGWHDQGMKDSNDTLFLCVVRNPYDWLSALFESKHHVPFHMKTFESFLLSEWYSIHHGNRHPDYGKERTDDRYWKDNSRHKNIFQMRERKLLYLHDTVPSMNNNHYHIRYEDLCNNLEGVIASISEVFSIKIKNKNFEKTKHKQPYNIENRHKDIINKNINWDVESLFNYQKNQRRY
jgi:hypothetical protein